VQGLQQTFRDWLSVPCLEVSQRNVSARSGQEGFGLNSLNAPLQFLDNGVVQQTAQATAMTSIILEKSRAKLMMVLIMRHHADRHVKGMGEQAAVEVALELSVCLALP
jgi:hypothetical protein